jgi:putative acetyltransferase
MTIVEDDHQYLPDLIRLNEMWISEHFRIEDIDRQLSEDPEAIIRNGGHTFSAVVDGAVVGVVALFRVSALEFELARMAVEPSHRGGGIGRALAVRALDRAEAAGAQCVTLLSNTKLVPAIALYRSLGFEPIREGQHPKYQRCNIVMQKLFESPSTD